MSCKDFIRKYLSEKDSEDFAKWAWGDKYKEISFPSDEPVNLWNSRHGMKLELFGHGQPYIDIPKMVDIWKKECGYEQKKQ